MEEEPQSNGEPGAPVAAVEEAVEEASATADPPPVEPVYYASIYPGPEHAIPADFARKVLAVEEAFAKPTWVLVQKATTENPFGELGPPVWDGFFAARDELVECEEIALVLDSPGGFARETYQLAKLFQRHCGGFDAIVPRMAKSAATLLILGSDRRFMGRDAELGPLDVQLLDFEEEEVSSPLDEVQALERLNNVALDLFDQTLFVLRTRTKKKLSTLMPMALDFTAEMMRPLLEKVETVHYAKQSRLLKVAEEYGTRLLEKNFAEGEAKEIASRFVNAYNEHGFVISPEEADSFFPIREGSEQQKAAIKALEEHLAESDLVVIGRITKEEVEGGANADIN
jgi:Serine dehydrogenase proteinase